MPSHSTSALSWRLMMMMRSSRFLRSERYTVDLNGLNDHRIAHADTKAFFCLLEKLDPTILAIPDQWIRQFAPVFHLRPLVEFSVAHSHFTAHRGPRSLGVFAASLNPEVVRHCDASHKTAR